MDRDEVEVHKLAKKERGQYPVISNRTNLVNKGFIIWLLGKFCSRDTAGSPERARWLHLARSGSQSQRAIWFILPTRGAGHIISNNYYTIFNNSGIKRLHTSYCKVQKSLHQRSPCPLKSGDHMHLKGARRFNFTVNCCTNPGRNELTNNK